MQAREKKLKTVFYLAIHELCMYYLLLKNLRWLKVSYLELAGIARFLHFENEFQHFVHLIGSGFQKLHLQISAYKSAKI